MWPFGRRKREFIQGLGKNHPHTPDMAVLEQSTHQFLFVCDDMMVPHKNHELIKGHGQKVGRGFSQQRFDYRIGRHSGKALPLMAKDGLRVKGELHAIESHHFDTLDRHYKNGVEFARVPIRIIVTNRDHQLVDIGNEYFIRKLPPGMIRTVPELGIRHYISNPHVSLLKVQMYVAIRAHWLKDADADKSFPPLKPSFPKEPLVWLPKYYKYPIERNRCLK